MSTSPARKTVTTMTNSALNMKSDAMQEITALEVTRTLERLFSSISEKATMYGPEFSRFVNDAFESLCGGKLLRPTLLLEALDALAPECTEIRDIALDIAAALEFLHFSFLLHDDVIDGDLLRRGRLNFIGSAYAQQLPGAQLQATDPGLLDPSILHWARSSGILMGDLLLSAAHQIIVRQDLPHSVRLRLLDVLEHSITESVAGEFLDVGLSDEVITPDVDTALAMSRLKTATYTFELPLRMACVLAGLPETVEERVGSVGAYLGTIFQLQDDYLSTFGDAAEHGKDVFSDLREGKQTTIIAFARSTDVWEEISPNFGDKQLNREQGLEIRSLLIRCGAEAYSRSLIEHHIDVCAQQIDTLKGVLPTDMITMLERRITSMAGRRS